ATLRGNGKLALVAEPGIKESPGAVHFINADIRVPVGHRAESSPRMKVHARQAIGRRNQRAGPLTIGSEALPVYVQFSIKTARAPTRKDLFDCRHIYPKQVRERLQVG